MTKIPDFDLDVLFELNQPSSSEPQTGLRFPPQQDSVDEWLTDFTLKTERPRPSQRKLDAYTEEATRRANSGDWDDVTAEQAPHLLVALYLVCHARVYGVKPLELTADFYSASMMAKKQLRLAFSDDVTEAVEFVRWTWNKEKRKQEWMEQQGFDGKRIGWRLQFGHESRLLTDYRHAMARKNGIG